MVRRAVVEHLINNLHGLISWLPELAILEADVYYTSTSDESLITVISALC